MVESDFCTKYFLLLKYRLSSSFWYCEIPVQQCCVALPWNMKQKLELTNTVPQSIVDVVLLFIQNTRSLDNEDDGEMIAWLSRCCAFAGNWWILHTFYYLRPVVLGRMRKNRKDDMFAVLFPDGAPMYYLDLIISSPVDREASMACFPSLGASAKLPVGCLIAWYIFGPPAHWMNKLK